MEDGETMLGSPGTCGLTSLTLILTTCVLVAALPQSALPRIVAEKVKEMYLNLERGTAIGGDLSRKPDESKGRKRRRARDEQDVEGDQREWGPMNKAMADEAGMQFPKLLKPLDVREGQQMYHAPHDHERAMDERGVVSIPPSFL